MSAEREKIVEAMALMMPGSSLAVIKANAEAALYALSELGYAVVPREASDAIGRYCEERFENGWSGHDVYAMTVAAADIAREPAPQLDPADPREPQNEGDPTREAALAGAPQNTTRAEE